MSQHLTKVIFNYFPVLAFVSVLWMIHYLQWYLDTSFSEYGLYPRSITGLRGIITMPFLHGSLEHLVSNSAPLLVLGAAMTYFYHPLYRKVTFWIIIAGGFWLWLGGRPSFHIGASGLVYGLSAFLFFSGIIRRDLRLMAISLLVVFLYGGMVWGIFPLFREISWEGHLFGGAAGALMAWVFRGQGPQRKKYEWEMDDYEEDDEEDGYWNERPPGPYDGPGSRITYIYRKNKNDQNKGRGNEEN